jgi:ubiquinone/menaquinone biosynthesis C-methylase UbiE
MSLTDKERQTLEKYDVSAEDWLEHSGGRDRPCFWTEQMAEFITQLRGDKKVLEVGCGPATDGVYLDRLGADVISTDYSTAMLAIAREINPKGKYMRMDMQDLFFKDNSFNGFWASACLLHLENPDQAIRELVRVTKKDGIGFISIKEGDGENVDPRTRYYFRYYHHPEFVRKLRRLGLETLQSGRKTGTPSHDYLTYLVGVVK